MPSDAVDEFKTYAGALLIPFCETDWDDTANGYRAEFEVAGGPATAHVRVVIYVQRQPWPHGSVSLIWRGTRVRNIDIVGPMHQHPLTAEKIPTPHCQWLDDAGRLMVEPVDLDETNITGIEDAFRWLLEWCSIESDAAWREPPLQVPLEGMTGRRPRRQRRRR